MKSLYPEDEWDFLKPIRDQFFGGREKDREKTCKALSKVNFQFKKKALSEYRRIDRFSFNEGRLPPKVLRKNISPKGGRGA